MSIRKTFVFIIISSFIFFSDCNSQSTDRKPVFAGKFYPADKNELIKMFDDFFAKDNGQNNYGKVQALISPHAGYVFSGEVAAAGYARIRNTKYDNVFILGPSHRVELKGASIYNAGNYITPLGKAEINFEIANQLIKNYDFIEFNEQAHKSEHSVEVQVPFVQYVFGESVKIIPVVIGGYSAGICRKLAAAFKPYFNENNLFIISTDFSHYPAYEDAKIVDSRTAAAIMTNDVGKFIDVINQNTEAGIKNLSTSICGWPAVLTLLYMTTDKDFSISEVKYKNSGDSDYGDKSNVVGYYSITFVRNQEDKNKMDEQFTLSKKDQKELLYIARQTIKNHIEGKNDFKVDTDNLTSGLMVECGSFVTLHKYGELRGCIGRFISNDPLYKVVQQMAVASATQDTRFSVVKEDEIDDLEIEISVLSPLKLIESIEEIELGKHGIYIIKGNRAGTFLPQVATETGWSLDEFLGHCARDKAGIGWTGWKEAEIYIYTADVFSEKELGIR